MPFPSDTHNFPIVAVLGVGRNSFNGTLPTELGLLNSLGMLSRNGGSSRGVNVDQPFSFLLTLLKLRWELKETLSKVPFQRNWHLSIHYGFFHYA